MNEPIILFRTGLAEENEQEIAKKYFPVCNQRTKIPNNSLVIPRYSSLPYYEELCQDIANLNSAPINSFRQHCYLANLSSYYEDLKELTFQTWFHLDQIPSDNNIKFVLKGETNSKKFNWKTHMFANNKQEAINVFLNLSRDSLIGSQNICIRKYVPLKTYFIGPQDIPITKEYRFFFYKDKPIASGFYWANYESDIVEQFGIQELDSACVPSGLIEKVANIVSKHANFWVADFAQTESGNWLLVELNDGTMSGLSCIDPNMLYGNLLQQIILNS